MLTDGNNIADVVTLANDDNSISVATKSVANKLKIKVANGGITSNHLAVNSVNSSKIVNGAVGTTKIADSAVTDAKIGSCNVNKLTQTDGDILVLDGGNASGRVA